MLGGNEMLLPEQTGQDGFPNFPYPTACNTKDDIMTKESGSGFIFHRSPFPQRSQFASSQRTHINQIEVGAITCANAEEEEEDLMRRYRLDDSEQI